MTHGLYLLGPLIEFDDADSHLIMAHGSARSFTVDAFVVPAGTNPKEAQAEALEYATAHSRDVQVFDCEHALLLRAVKLWPNKQTRRALAELEASMELADALNAAGVKPEDTWH